MNSCLEKLISERNYIHLNVNKIYKLAAKRGTKMGKKFKEYDGRKYIPIQAIIE